MNEDEGLHIKCHICDTKYVKESVPIELVEGSGQFEDSDAYKCPKCGDIVFDTSQLEALRSKVTHFRIRRKLGVSGNALVLRIPADIREFCNLAKGDFVEIMPLNEKKFIVEVA